MRSPSISTTIVDDEYPSTPMAPRGKRSDLTEKDLEEFTLSFSLLSGYLEKNG